MLSVYVCGCVYTCAEIYIQVCEYGGERSTFDVLTFWDVLFSETEPFSEPVLTESDKMAV